MMWKFRTSLDDKTEDTDFKQVQALYQFKCCYPPIIRWAGENNRVGIRQHRRRRLLVRLKGKVNDVKDKVIDRAGLTDSPNHMTLDLYIS